MIRFATQDMVPALKTIWQVCFGEEQAYVDFAFTELIRPEHVLVYCDETGEAQAMLCLQPALWNMSDGSAAKCAYIYGVATLPRARGKGLSTMLMEAAHKKLKRKGFALSVLVPASETLFDFYSQRGFEAGFSINKAAVESGALSAPGRECVLVPSSLERLEQERNAFFAGSKAFVQWDKNYLKAIDSECSLLNGQVLRFVCAGQKGYAVCYRFDKTVLVKELAAPGEIVDDVLHALHRRFGAETYRIYLREDIRTKFTNAVLPYALVRWYDKKIRTSYQHLQGMPGYIAHVLD